MMSASTMWLNNCVIPVGTMWAAVAALAVTLIALCVFNANMANRRIQHRGREIRRPVRAREMKGDEAGKEARIVVEGLQAVQNTDLEDTGRMQVIGEEIKAMATLSSDYTTISARRRFLSRKIACNAVVEVSRRHSDLRISTVFAGSTHEGLGDILQQIQYFQAVSEEKHLEDAERGSCEEYAKRPIFSSDLDVMIVPLAVCIGPNGDLEYEHIESKPLSFVKLKPTARSNLGELSDCLSDSGYLSARAVRKLFYHALLHATYVYCGPSVAVAVEEHGAAVEMKWAEPSVEGDFFETVLIADFTFALRITDWPRCALNWTERARNWPSQHLTAAVAAGGCHAIAFYRDASDDECQWRLSFSKAEVLLFSALPPQFRDMCIALKALFKSRIQPYCPALSSYHLKTVVLWTVEQAPSNLLSSSDGAAIALVKALDLLRDNVRDGRLPHYFVSGHNIVPQMSQCEIKTATDAILDAALYADRHLTRLRASEARYFDAKDYLLVLLPGEEQQPKSAVQVVIQRLLNKTLNAIPDAFDEIPLNVPTEPVLVHLLTGKVVKLSCEELAKRTRYRECKEILTAVEQEHVNSVKANCYRINVKASFKKALSRQMRKGLVYDTERSLENASRYASRVKHFHTVQILTSVVLLAFLAGVSVGAYLTVAFCTDDSKLSQADIISSIISSSYRVGAKSSLSDLDIAAPILEFEVTEEHVNVLPDVNLKLPSVGKLFSSIRG